jgi:hypothetical protein
LRNGSSLLLFLVFFLATCAEAHDGPFLRLSIGSGYYAEDSGLHESGFTTPAKNHAIGWGFHHKFALQISDFGGLIKKSVGECHYINLDALGLGLTYRMPLHMSVTLSGGQSTVTFTRNWWENTSGDKDTGYAMNVSVDKEWPLSQRWGAGIGSHGFLLKTNGSDYEFIQVGITGTITYYFTPMR